MRFQALRRRSVLGPKSKFPCGQPLLHQPESLTIVRKALYGCSPTVSENKQAAGKRISLQYRFADSGESIYAVSKIDGFHCHQDSHLRCNLDHRLPLQNVSLRSFRSGVPIPLRWIRIFAPFRFSHSMIHSEVDPEAAGLSSINAGASS